MLNINREDTVGFRLDTLTTHKLHRTPVVQGKEILITRTDYVKLAFAVTDHKLQISHQPKLLEMSCWGAGVFPKNAAQHAADLSKLENERSVNAIFINPLSDTPKEIECIQVDGATDEGPVHLEMQFWWTLRHLHRPTRDTLVSTRNSGASYLNRVELQNGCLALAHANLFILSNLNGSCGDLSDENIRQLSKSTLLPPQEVEMWIEHLQTIQNNRRGAEKAAATRQQKKANEKLYYCICREEYADITDEVQHWIGCDNCSCGFHCQCVNIEPSSIPDVYLCSKCSK